MVPSVNDLRIWCEHAWLGGWSTSPGVVIEVEGGRIADIGTGFPEPPAGAQVLPGVTLPGFVNSFATLSDRALRGFEGGREELSAAGTELSECLDLERWTALAQAVLAEMSLAGFTTVGAVVPVIAGLEPLRVFRSMVDAAERVGVRLTGFIPAPVGSDDPSELDRWMSSLADTFDHLKNHDLCRGAALVHDVSTASVPALRALSHWAGQTGGPFAGRVSADLDAHNACKAAHDATPIEVFHEVGALANRGGFLACHGVAMTDDDAALLGQSRGAVCVTATGDRELGTGVISLDALRNNGARIVVGTAIGAVIDPFLELRTMEGHARLSAGRRPVLSPAELLRSATTDGTIALGWRDAGLLASGQRADLVTVSLHTPRMAGTDPDAVLAHLTSSATAADITHVTVNGELIAEHGMHRSGDVTAMLEAALAAVR